MQIIPPGTQLPDEWEHRESSEWSILPADRVEGAWSSMFTRARAGRQARTLRALTETMQVAKAYFDARTLAIESCLKAQEHEYRLQALPERNADQRSDEYYTRRHADDVRQLNWRREYDSAEVLAVSARQALDAQRATGEELAWKKRRVELLDVELDIAERRAVLHRHLQELDRTLDRVTSTASARVLEDALYEARAQLTAHGIDTSAIDTVLERRNNR